MWPLDAAPSLVLASAKSIGIAPGRNDDLHSQPVSRDRAEGPLLAMHSRQHDGSPANIRRSHAAARMAASFSGLATQAPSW